MVSLSHLWVKFWLLTASVEKNSFGIKIPGEIGSQTGICIFIRDGNELLQEISEFNQEIKEQWKPKNRDKGTWWEWSGLSSDPWKLIFPKFSAINPIKSFFLPALPWSWNEHSLSLDFVSPSFPLFFPPLVWSWNSEVLSCSSQSSRAGIWFISHGIAWNCS